MELKRNQGSFVISAASLVIALIVIQICITAKAQTNTSFTPADWFDIPSTNGKIGFSENGTYAKATLTNDTWAFNDLKLNGSTPIEMFIASAQSSSIIITSYRATNTTQMLRYIAEGQGRQTFNMGIPAEDRRWGLHPEWSVIINNEWLGEGDRWSITPDGNVTVTGAVGNVSIVHYGFLGLDDDSSDLTFYEQHSVAIITILSVAATAIVATLMMTRNKAAKPTEKAATLLD